MKNYRLDSSSVNVNGTDYSSANCAMSSRNRFSFFIIIQNMFNMIAKRIKLS